MQRTLLPLLLCLLAAACGHRRPPVLHPDTPGAVASPETWATVEGERALRDGGNAADAAATIGFVLAVTHPEAGNLGGGAFVLVHTAQGEDVVVDGREVAPRAAKPELFLDSNGKPRKDASLIGPLAAGVPGSVAAYLMVHERFGQLPRERVLEPAIRLAQDGFRVGAGLRDSIARNRALLAQYPQTAAIFLPGGRVPAEGDTLRQPELAKVLASIAKDGANGFYRGWFPERVQTEVESYGGILTTGDFYTYAAKEREPLRGSYRGCEVLTMPPPSSGGVCLLQMLDMLELGGYADMRDDQRLHLFAEAGRRAFADRALYFADPDFVEVPVARLLAPAYVQERFTTISMSRATPSEAIHAGLQASAESEETCHYSVVDDDGNAVSCTTTLNGAFGCGLAVSGVLLNNEMDDFTIQTGVPNQFGLLQSPRNGIEPGKRPLSSMTPTILLRDGKPFLVLGSPGGPTIISVVCEVIANYLAAGMTLQDAVAAPRIHCQWMPDEVVFESLTPEERHALEALGHRLRQRDRPMGDVQAVGISPLGNLMAVSDPRGHGRATR